MKEFHITPAESGQRLDKYLKKLLPEAASSFLYKMLRKKNITVNGRKTDGSVIIADGDKITLYLSDETFEKFHSRPSFSLPETGHKNPLPALQVLYENADILIVNKPSGRTAVPCYPRRRLHRTFQQMSWLSGICWNRVPLHRNHWKPSGRQSATALTGIHPASCWQERHCMACKSCPGS